METPDVDSEFAKLLGAQNAQARQAMNASAAIADVLVAFRVRLIVGGFTPEDAADMSREYFGAMLDQMTGGTSDPPEDAG